MWFFSKLVTLGGTMLFSTASVVASKTVFGSSQPQEIELPETIGQIRARMARFTDELKDGDVVPVSSFPMPGETMLWLTPKEGNQWKRKFENWEKSHRLYVKVKSVNELKKWCQIQKEISNVRIVRKDNQDPQFKTSIDSYKLHTYIVQANDFSDLKNYCARPITNKEWFGRSFRKSPDIMAMPMIEGGKAQSCEFWMHQPYTKHNENKLQPCWRISNEGDEVVDTGNE